MRGARRQLTEFGCGRILGSRCRSYGCQPSRPSRGRRRRIATMLSSPIRRQARWGRYRGCAWGEARRAAQAAGQRAIAPSRRDEARAPAGDDEHIAGNRPRQISRTPTPATHARTNCKPTTPAGLSENPACPDQGPGCVSGAARPRATAPYDSASAAARPRSAPRRGGIASTQDNPSRRRDWIPTPSTRARSSHTATTHYVPNSPRARKGQDRDCVRGVARPRDQDA